VHALAVQLLSVVVHTTAVVAPAGVLLATAAVTVLMRERMLLLTCERSE
jgi:hypothetical protein